MLDALIIGQSARFHCDNNYFVLGGICTRLRVSSFLMSREFRFLTTKFLACSKPQAKIIMVKRPIQGRNNVTRVWVKRRLCNYSCRKNKLWHFWPRFWESQENSLSLLNIKKISFLAKAVKIFIFC